MMNKIKIRDFYITIDRCLIYKKYGIISDTHIGFDVLFGEGGANFPNLQKDEVVKNALNIIEKYRIDKLVINGDIKHNFMPYKREIEFLKEFISILNDYVDLILIRGNHDSSLPLDVVDYLKLGKYLIFHGDRMLDDDVINKSDFFILGHEHPSVKLRDEVGAVVKFPVYLIYENKDLKDLKDNNLKGYVVLPAFNPLSPGNDLINNSPSSKIIRKNYLDVEVVAITEIGLLNFGKLKEIREFSKFLL
ncbi:MAG: hypothetical protein GXN95_01260 [Methanococci archaeon]|nr:hypothetical protein [Methanococci archaeon]